MNPPPAPPTCRPAWSKHPPRPAEPRGNRSPPRERTRVRGSSAAAVAAGTSLLFLVCYGGVSYLTSFRSDVGTWYYSWERFIPFVPWMIVPYMSIDLLFVAAPFLCRDDKELRVLAQRLTAVVIGAAVCFVLYPLQLAVPRPHASGWFGELYNWFTALDRPYNLCPSMHIALRVVLAAHYGRYCRGLLGTLTHTWFFLIGCSTLLLYQHHVVDVVGGFVLALLVMYVFDGRPWRSPPFRTAPKLAACYVAAGVLFLSPLLWEPALGWLTAWPAAACLLVAAGYAALGPAVYRRQDGRLSPAARWLLGPVLLGQRLSRSHYARRSPPLSHITDGVWIGRHLEQREAPAVIGNRIGAVIDLCVAFDDPTPLRNLPRLELPVLDLTAPTPRQLDQACAFLERHRHRGVLVHCKAGYSRSVAVVAAWLIQTGRAGTPAEAFAQIRAARNAVVIRPEIRQLKRFAPPAKG